MPVCQWVISVPKRLRWFLAERSEATCAPTTIFMSEVERLVREAAGPAAAPATADTKRPRIGAISFLHRFGSALNSHVHFHACVTDGGFQRAAPAPHADAATPAVAFHAARPMTPRDLDTLTMAFTHADPTWVFLVSSAAIVPLADMLAKATEELAELLGPSIGGVLSATLGNGPELIVCGFALSKGLTGVVKSAIIGTVLIKVLLLSGLAMFFGGLKRTNQKFNKTTVGMSAAS